MRDYQLLLLGLFAGFIFMFGLNPDMMFDPGYGNDVSRNTTIGSTHPLGEKFGGGVKIHDFNGDYEIEIDPTGPGGN